MERFDRQRRIQSWNQDRLRNSRVIVCGRGWLGTFTVWGLASLGIGEVLWTGIAPEQHDSMVRWLLSKPDLFQGVSIHDYPIELEFGGELSWIAAGQHVDAVVSCSEDASIEQHCARYADISRAALHCGRASGQGWIGRAPRLDASAGRAHPVVAMIAAGLLVDAVRESLMPVLRTPPIAGDLLIDTPWQFGADRCLLVGAGGIGVYAATLAALLGIPIHVKDDDCVDTTNLNRQGLFTMDDAEQRRFKSLVAADVLGRLFPRARLTADIARADENVDQEIVDRQATLLLSAVDNAESRLLLQQAAIDRGIPLVQAGTDVFAADVYTQQRDGASIDQQMHGAMTKNQQHEAQALTERRGGCAADPSYVVPGMIAGGLMMHRALQVSELYRGLAPFHWRAGAMPVEMRERRSAFGVFDHV